MQLRNQIFIRKPILPVWEVLGNQFSEVHLWASAVTHSVGDDHNALEAVGCAARICDVQGFGRIRENVTELDDRNFVLSYEVVDGFPFFVKRGSNRWSLTSENNGTRVRIEADVETKGLVGWLMTPIMKLQMGSLLRRAIEDLKIYVETGAPHPRKKKAPPSQQSVANTEAV